MRMAKWMAAAALVAFAAGADLIKEVEVRQLDGFIADTGDVLAMCGSKPGAELSQVVLFDDVRRLNDSQRFSYAGVEVAPVDGGVKVIYVVRRRYRLAAPAEITGMSAVSRSKIAGWLDLKEGAYIDEQLLGVRCAKVRDEYMKRYYPNVQVTGQLTAADPQTGLVNVVVGIEEGGKVILKGYVFNGNEAISDSELKAAFKQYDWWNPRNWFSGRLYDEQQFEEAREAMLALYRDRGYLDAAVSPVRLEPVAEGEKNVRAVIDVTEGPCYTVGSLDITGVTLFPEEQVRAAAAIGAGANAGAPLNAAVRRMREYFTSRGYADAWVRTMVDTPPETPGVAKVTLDVSEGVLVTLRNIVINGNTRTKDKVIRREILVAPGDVADLVRIERSMNRLRNMRYFSEVRESLVAGETNAVRDLVVNVAEQRTGNFMIGAGFSTIDDFMGFIEISQNNFDILNWPNFTGGGQKARLGAEFGSERQTIEANWIEPWLFDRPVALQVDAYRRQRDYDEFEDIRTGGAVGLSYPVKVGRIGFKQTFEQVELDDVIFLDDFYSYANDDDFDMTDPDSDAYMADDTAFNSMSRVYWTYDTRNLPFVPTRGTEATLFGEGGVGDFEIYRLGLSFRKWFGMPWRGGHVLSLRTRLETVDSYGDDPVPIHERLYLGGGRTVRGFDYRSLGPKVSTDTDGNNWHPVGGQTMLFASAEYTIPIVKALRLATFIDAGSLDADAFSGETSDYGMSAGLGLRVDIPGFPIRIDYAKPIVEPDNTEEQSFIFWIGFE